MSNWNKFIVGLALVGMLSLMLAASLRAISDGRQRLQADQQQQACLQTVTAELELLAINALDGNKVVVEQGTVTIYQPGGEVLATGEFLAGTELCHDLLRRVGQ